MNTIEICEQAEIIKPNSTISWKEGFVDGAEWMQKKLESENAALRQQIADMGEVINELRAADMTHEYNQAEAERVWPQIEQQIRDDEREKVLAQFGVTKE